MSRHKPPTQKKIDFFEVLKERTPQARRIVTNRPNGQAVAAEIPLKIRTMPVAWGLPLDEIVFSKWLVNFLGIAIMPWDPLLFALHTYLPTARNIIHRNFLEGCDAQWLVMLDSDVMPPPNFLERLLSYKLPMVGGWYRRKGGENDPVVYDFQGMGEDGRMVWKARKEPGQGLEKVDGAGAGCWLMHRSVAEAIGKEPYDMLRGGEDLDLCLKVKQAGFEIYIDWNLACAHAGVMYV